MERSFLNLDINASMGLHPEVEARLRQTGDFGLNPSSVHRAGQRARALIEEARERLARLLVLSPGDRVVFTSGATEANNMAVGYAAARAQRHTDQGSAAELLISAVEHPCVLEPARALERQGLVKLTYFMPNTLRDQAGLRAHITPRTVMLSCIWANNETGEIYPVPELFSRVRALAPQTLLHTDAVQLVGRAQGVTLSHSGADLLTVSGHKLGALPGVGALIVRAGIEVVPLLRGGSQEVRWRAGTENVHGIVSLGIAAEVCQHELTSRIECMRTNRDLLRAELFSQVSDLSMVTADAEAVVPNTLSVSVAGLRGDDLVVAADLGGIAISSGAACSSGKQEPSHVLLAKGLSPAEARQVIRLSVSGRETEHQIRWAAATLASAITTMRGAGSLGRRDSALSQQGSR